MSDETQDETIPAGWECTDTGGYTAYTTRRGAYTGQVWGTPNRGFWARAKVEILRDTLHCGTRPLLDVQDEPLPLPAAFARAEALLRELAALRMPPLPGTVDEVTRLRAVLTGIHEAADYAIDALPETRTEALETIRRNSGEVLK